jgi:hypothetical protein
VLLAALAMAAIPTNVATTTKTAVQVQQCILQAAAFVKIVLGLTLALILSGLFRRLSFRHKLQGLVVCCVEAECSFVIDACVKAGIKDDIIFAIAYSSAHHWMQSIPE